MRNARPGMLLDPGNPINEGLAAWWPLWEGAGGALDISGNNNLGTLFNGASWADGVRFDGVDDVILVGQGVRPTLPLSVHVRCKFNSLPAQGGLFAADKSELSGSFHSGFLVAHGLITAGKISVNYGDNTANNASGRRTKTGTTTPALGVVHNITCVIRGAADMTILLNGVDDGGTYSGTGGTMAYKAFDGSIGRFRDTNAGDTKAMDGYVYDCRVWDRALSEFEAENLHINPNAGLWIPDTKRYYVAAAGGADVRKEVIQSYMRAA